MKTNNTKMQSAVFVVLAALVATGCSLSKNSDALTSGQLAYNSTDPNAEIPGQGSTSAPTAEAVIGRLALGLQGNASPMAGNFASVITQVSGNLPQVSDPIKAVGWDQVPLLVYAACADITQAVTLSAYGVDTSKTIATQRAALISAGVKFTDQYVAGMASTGPQAAAVSTAFGTLVDADALVAGETTKQAFISVCMAANAFGVGMRGF